MKKQILLSLLCSTAISVHYLHSQEEPRKKPLEAFVKTSSELFNIVISGYSKLDTFFDTRQVAASPEGDAALFPKKKLPDKCDRDINSNGQFHMLALETRIRLDITGPEVLDARVRAAIEGDFTALGLFTLRHAFTQIDWKTFSLSFGQYWHPIFVEECSADPLPADGGNPMALVSRNPQIRFTYHFEHVDLIAAALGQFPFFSDGPLGRRSIYARDSLTPNFHFHAKGHIGDHYVGAGIDFKRLVPRLVTNKNVRASESISSTAGTAYFALNWEKFAWHTKLNAGQNMTNFEMLGGYAVKCVNDVTDQRDYANLRVLGIWSEFIGRTKHLEPALFIGYTKNFGAGRKIIQSITDEEENEESTIYALGPNIDNVFRISPRLRWFVEPVTIGLEFEYTRAAYGTITDTGSVTKTKPVANTRFLLSAFYFF